MIKDGFYYSMYIILFFDIYGHVKNKKTISFIIRYSIVYILFKKIEIFDIGLINSILFKLISLGTIIYYVAFYIVKFLMIPFDRGHSDLWKFIYFIVYVFIAVVFYLVLLFLSNCELLPIKLL